MTNSQVLPAEAARELLIRRTARRSFEAFCRRALAPLGLEPQPHHLLLIRELQHVADTPGDRVIVMMPPGSAKSTYTSVLFPPWFMGRAGRLNVIGASHTATLAEAFSGRAQGTVRDNSGLLGYGLATEAKERWQTTTGGEYLAAGVGGAVTGFRADLGLIDDPVRSHEDADSEVKREKAWNWYLSDFITRLKPGGRVAIVMTRWHDDDLAGRLLLHYPDQWRVVKLPAMAEEDDPLGRAIGAPLWADDPNYRYGAELAAKKAGYEASGSMRAWWALYQQSPRNPDGALFQVAKIATVDVALPGKSVRAWDLAATADSAGHDPDWTCGVKLTRVDSGAFVISDVVRLRGGPDVVEAAIVNTAAQDGRTVTVGLPQDPGQAGKVQVQYLTKRLAGYSVQSTPETGDKATRAGPAAAQVNVGNVSVIRAAWNRPFIEELRDFPTGRKDDQVDALSRAMGMLTILPGPTKITPLRL